MEKFALDSMKIKSSWFTGGKESMFQKMGKDEGLNLYLQLFRFRVHQGNINEHNFIFSVSELRQYTKVNMAKKLSHKQILDMLIKMEKLGIIKNHKAKWATYTDSDGKVLADKIIKLEATDVPKTNRVEEKDMPITEDDIYISIEFAMVDHIYGNGLSSKDLSIFYLIRRLSNSTEKKAWMNINTMESWLGYGDESITKSLVALNKLGIVATRVRKNGLHDKYEHYPVFGGVRAIPEFKKMMGSSQKSFLKRHKSKQSA
jgi:hypothetical protein